MLFPLSGTHFLPSLLCCLPFRLTQALRKLFLLLEIWVPLFQRGYNILHFMFIILFDGHFLSLLV